jgi:uncharacterized protein (TIGR00369 family)
MPLKKNYCFACGKDNPQGMHLRFALDAEDARFVSHFRLSERYTGPPGYCHGGIIATILDDAMSKLNKLRDVIAATSRLTIEYIKPVPLRTTLRAESRELYKRGRRLVRIAEICNQEGTVLARARGVFVIIDPKQVFKH